MKKLTFLFALALIFTTSKTLSQARITGKITDSKSQLLTGISIHVLNTNLGAVSIKGNYVLPKVAPGRYVILFSSVGYVNKSEEIKVEKDDLNINAVLEESGRRLNEVLVTAQKKEDLLQQLPLSVTAISAKRVAESRIWDSKDITAVVPNLYSADPGDKRNVTSIRGITSSSYDPAVATYIDGVNQFSLDTYISPLFDVERIEVLRGPQGTLYGRNAMGGVINIITRQPTNKTDVFAEASLGNHGIQRYSAGIKAPIIKDKLFFGAAGLYDALDGFYTNEYNNSKYDKQHSIVGNYYLKYLPNEKLSVTLNAKHNNNRNNGPFPLVFGVDEAFANPYKLNQNALTKIIDNTFNTSLSINYTGRSFNLQSQTSYQSNYRYYNKPIDADFSPIDGVTLINNYGKSWNNVKVVTQEFKLNSGTGSSSPFKWATGVYLFYQKSPTKANTHFGEEGTSAGAPDNNFSLINTSKSEGYGIAVYGQASYMVAKKLNITGGLRYDNEYKKLSVLGEYQKDPDPAFAIRPDTSAHANFNAVTPKIEMDYSFNSNHLLFVSYSRGFRAGGLTPLSSDPSQAALFPFKPEYSNNAEAGIKNSFFSSKLFFNVSLFYTTVTNAQVPTLILPEAITVTKNTGVLHSKGIEGELTASPIKGLEINYDAGYTSARYKNLKISQNGNEVDLKEKHPLFTPDYTSLLAIQYRYSLEDKSRLAFMFRAELKSVGMQYFDLANTLEQKSYSLINASAGLSIRHYQLVFWAWNISGKKYISYAYDFGAVHLGNPSTYGVTLRFNTGF
ncbi:MAG: TonB-dependent receptor [Ginsengibacter sp.]